MALPMGPLRELGYFSREELHGALTYEEHKDALLRSVPSHFGGFTEQWRLILKRKDQWWDDPEVLKWGKDPDAAEKMGKARKQVEQIIDKYKPEIQKMYGKKAK
jgi:hypothetical protein